MTQQPGVKLTESLSTLLQRGASAFATGDFAAAAAAFAEVEREYGDQPDWKEGQLPRRLLPLRGFAELRAGFTSDAADSLLTFLEQFPDETSSRNLALYSLALAQRQLGILDDAFLRFETFEIENEGSAQAALARFQRAEIRFEQGRIGEGIEILISISRDAPTDSLRTQARLRALQKSADQDDNDRTVALLFGKPWSLTTMPEIGVLAFTAMQVGDRLMAAGNGRDAIRAYRLVLPKSRLVEAQRENLRQLQNLFDERVDSVTTAGGSFWVDFYRARIARIQDQLHALEAADDYTASLQLRKGQACLIAKRPREAWLVFERLTFDKDTPADLRAEAQYRWILAAAELKAWEAALAVARDFVKKHDDHPQAIEALHLIARAHLEQRRMPEAESVLGDIIARFPNHPGEPRARFTRGWVRVMQEDFEAARADFDIYLAEHPEGPLAVNAGLWRALSFFFEREYDVALEALETLAAKFPNHHLYPEIVYRKGSTLYAMRAFDDALAIMESFVQDWPQHTRHPEALVLIGDILMAAGKLDEAIERFADVPKTAGAQYIYAIFQTGKILRAQGDYDGMVRHFTAFAQQEDAATLPRVSEALYWVGWAEEQRGNAAAAIPLFMDILERYGNEPEAGEIASTINALERIVRRLDRGEGSSFHHQAELGALMAGDFDKWLFSEREAAQEADRYTYYARMTLALADRHAKRKQPYQEEALLLEIAGIVPVDALDPPALARVGLVLRDIGSPESDKYFRHLLNTYPQSFDRGAAFYGLADSAIDGRRFEEARRWIARFDAETPTHPLAPNTALLAAVSLERERNYELALAAFEEILRLKSARGRVHAEAITGMARCARAMEEPRKAIAYSQRVYTMYRAYPDLVAEAYLTSGKLFTDIGDIHAAIGTFEEMLSLATIGDTYQREEAAELLAALEASHATPGSESEESTESKGPA